MKLDELKGWYLWPTEQKEICFLCETRHKCRCLHPHPFGPIWELTEWLCPTCLEIWKQENKDFRVAQEMME